LLANRKNYENVQSRIKRQNGNVVLKHNLFAKSNEDAKSKCKVLVENARDKQVTNFYVC